MIKEFGYEYDAVLDRKLWNECKGKVTNEKLLGANCLRSGRDALKAIAREYSPRMVLIPALACESMIMPFERYGHKVQFYKLNRDYSIDLKSLRIEEEPCLFLYMEYFGRPAICDLELRKLKEIGSVTFVEDRTHNLIWPNRTSFKPDYTIASLRKWLPIPDGGLLWGDMKESLSDDTSFSTTRLNAQCMRHEFLENGDMKLKNQYRRIFSSVSDIMDNGEPSAMSSYSYEKAKDCDWQKLREIRSENAKILMKILKDCPQVNLIQDEICLSDLYVAFTVSKRDEVQRRLSEIGIFNTVIWPLSDEQKEICQVSRLTEEHMLAAPCDQRYTPDDMEYIGREIVRIVSDVNK